MPSRTICITLLASEWKSSKGGLSTMNRELAIQLAKHPNVSVSFFVPKCSDEDKQVARRHNVKIVVAEELPGYDEPVDWLAFPPKHLVIDFVVGHGVILGKQAQIITKSHHCKWVQVVHTAPDELAMYKDYSDAISKGEKKQWAELQLCKMADVVVAVGPKLTEFYSAHLNSCGKRAYNLTPGIFSESSSLKLSFQSGKKFRLLVFGRGDTEDFELKGYDIAAQAVANLNDKSYHLTFVGASKGRETEVADELFKQGLVRSQLIVKGYLKSREYLTTFLCASNLAIIPSRTEGFGLTALEALSAGVPFLVSQNSGFGEALQELSLGSTFIVDSEDPEQWAEAIQRVRQKGSETAIQECQKLRTQYAEKYSWKTQSKELLRIMLTSLNGDVQSKKEGMSESSRTLTSLPERPTARERIHGPSTDVPGETKAPHIRNEGARIKEEGLPSTKSTLEAKGQHREIHEKALLHFLNPGRKGGMVKYQPPKPKLLPTPATSPPVGPSEPETSSRHYSIFVPEKPSAGDRLHGTKADVWVENRAHTTSNQGARPKEKRSSTETTEECEKISVVRVNQKPAFLRCESWPLSDLQPQDGGRKSFNRSVSYPAADITKSKVEARNKKKSTKKKIGTRFSKKDKASTKSPKITVDLGPNTSTSTSVTGTGSYSEAAEKPCGNLSHLKVEEARRLSIAESLSSGESMSLPTSPDYEYGCVSSKGPPVSCGTSIFIVHCSDLEGESFQNGISELYNHFSKTLGYKCYLDKQEMLEIAENKLRYAVRRVKHSDFLFICVSPKLKRIFDSSVHEIRGQLEDDGICMLRLVSDLILNDLANHESNRKGKFMTIILGGSSKKDVPCFLDLFLKFMWPKDERDIRRIIEGQQEILPAPASQLARPAGLI